MAKDDVVDIPVNAMGESYGRFRLIHPGSEASMLESMRQFGQILPVVVVAGVEPHHYELIDGFKRLRACRKLGLKKIQAKVLTLGERPVKAAILQLNWKARSIREMEEAMIVHSLHRDDQLSQVAIGLLLGRHKSWVCRRIALMEKLSEETLNHLKLGLIGPGHGRHLTWLPPGNQEKALQTVIKHRLSCRETEKLVAMLLERPRWEHENILHLPLEILEERCAPHPGRQGNSIEPSIAPQVRDFGQECLALARSLAAAEFDSFSPEEFEILVSATESVQIVLAQLKSLCALNAKILTP